MQLAILSLSFVPSIAGDASTQKNVTTWSFDKGVPNQQVGNVWVNTNEIVSLSMGGEFGVVDVREGNSKVNRVIQVGFLLLPLCRGKPVCEDLTSVSPLGCSQH